MAYFIVGRCLESYAYHIKVQMGYLIVTFFAVSLVASLTILFHTLRAACLNPANRLRDE